MWYQADGFDQVGPELLNQRLQPSQRHYCCHDLDLITDGRRLEYYRSSTGSMGRFCFEGWRSCLFGESPCCFSMPTIGLDSYQLVLRFLLQLLWSHFWVVVASCEEFAKFAAVPARSLWPFATRSDIAVILVVFMKLRFVCYLFGGCLLVYCY